MQVEGPRFRDNHPRLYKAIKHARLPIIGIVAVGTAFAVTKSYEPPAIPPCITETTGIDVRLFDPNLPNLDPPTGVAVEEQTEKGDSLRKDFWELNAWIGSSRNKVSQKPLLDAQVLIIEELTNLGLLMEASNLRPELHNVVSGLFGRTEHHTAEEHQDAAKLAIYHALTTRALDALQEGNREHAFKLLSYIDDDGLRGNAVDTINDRMIDQASRAMEDGDSKGAQDILRHVPMGFDREGNYVRKDYGHWPPVICLEPDPRKVDLEHRLNEHSTDSLPR